MKQAIRRRSWTQERQYLKRIKYCWFTKTMGLGLYRRGWCDVLESVQSNTEKEVREETGLNVKAVKIIAVQDRNKHNKPVYAYGVCKIFVLCEVIGGEFAENIETIETRYFSLEDLPDHLAEEKTSKEQIVMCFQAFSDANWQTQFD